MTRLTKLMGCWMVLAGLVVGELSAQSRSSVGLPFGAGESLVYQVRSTRFGGIGRGTMRVAGVEEIRGRSTYHVQFELQGRVGPFTIEDQTESWLDPAGPAALRFEKRERHPLATRSEVVELFPAESRWSSADGRSGVLVTDNPLDELSFIYLLRMIELEEGGEISLNRHYDVERNPVRLRLVSRERVSLPAGVFPVLIVEMHVRDGKRFNGSGVLRLYLTDDPRRYPVRIETTMPVIGSLILDLETLTPASEKSVPESGILLENNPVNPDQESMSSLTAGSTI